MITDEVNKGANCKDMVFAFDLNEFFATNDSGKLIHEAEVNQWFDTLTHNEKYPFSTPELRAELKHTLWLLIVLQVQKHWKNCFESRFAYDNKT